MSSQELSRVVETQLDSILSKAFPTEIRFFECDNLIKIVTRQFRNVPQLDFDNSNDFTPKIDAKFVIENCSTGERYDVNYSRRFLENAEERLSIIKDEKEKVNLITYRYVDGRKNAFIEYFDDYPEFKVLKSTNLEDNIREVSKLVNELSGLLRDF